MGDEFLIKVQYNKNFFKTMKSLDITFVPDYQMIFYTSDSFDVVSYRRCT